MAATKTDIMNIALSLQGQDPMASPDEDTKKGRSMRRRYPDIRNAVLRAHPWNCAKRRANLAELSPAPAFGWDHRFRLPADYERALMFNQDHRALYVIESTDTGRELLTNDTTAQLVYVWRLKIVPFMDSLLVEAIGARLASDTALHITGSPDLTTRLWNRYESKLQEARSVDGQEEPVRELIATDWIDSHFIGGFPFTPIVQV